ncbi:hypothetical protein HAX54_002055 [Datura stramonium]|uniref:Uncharacterized protein n=1 Tax=Datura stramonium TaxID=4076 RepID=A0ABS8T4J9_DATST|nr:hypothetical protein [Datura stramonium]
MSSPPPVTVIEPVASLEFTRNMEENKQPVLDNGEHQLINKEVDNSPMPQTFSKQRTEGTCKSQKGNSSLQWGIRVEEEQEAEEKILFEEDIQRNVVEIVSQAAETGSSIETEVRNEGGEGDVDEKQDDQDKAISHSPNVIEYRSLAVREPNQMSSTENTRQSPNRDFHKICSHEGIDVMSV